MQPHFIIFSGYNERGVITFLRELVAHNVDFSIIANGVKDRIFSTAYLPHVAFTRETPELNPVYIFDILQKVCAKKANRRHIVAPSTEALNRFFLHHARECEQTGVIIPLVDEALYSQISNKYSFTQLCVRNGFDVPREIDSPATAHLPFVAKPRSYGSGSFLIPILVMNENDRQTFLHTADINQYFYQEFVTGKSLYLLMYITRDGEVTAFSQENLIQQPGGKSVIAAKASTLHTLPLKDQYADFLKGLGFSGIIMIEVRESNGCYYMIEANPRFWGPSQLFVDAMPYNIFQRFLEEYGVSCQKRSEPSNKLYYWHEGFHASAKLCADPVFHNYSWDNYMEDIELLMRAEIYRRQDTKKVFKQIISGAFCE